MEFENEIINSVDNCEVQKTYLKLRKLFCH